MKFRIIEGYISNNIYYGNHMVDLPREWGEGPIGEEDYYEYRDEIVRDCPYNKCYKGDCWCVFNLPEKEKTDIAKAYEDENEDIVICPSDIEECPDGRFLDKETWLNQNADWD